MLPTMQPAVRRSINDNSRLDVDRVAEKVQKICDRYGDRDHLLLDIVAHLRSLGRYVEIEYSSVH